MGPDEKCCVAAPAEPLNSIASDIIDTLVEVNSNSRQINDKLFPTNAVDTKSAQNAEPVTLEQKLVLIRNVSREIGAKLFEINSRL
jgi:hypothetical protein